MVGDTNPELSRLTDQFVCVRVVQMGGVDLSIFQFDSFLSWCVFAMNADKLIYARYGTAHPQTKRHEKDSNPTPTVEGLERMLNGVLEIHAQVEAQPELASGFRGKTGPEPTWRFAEKTPAARKYKRMKRVTKDGVGCVHCHEVHRVIVDSYFMTDRRVTDDMLWLYPRPSVVGLEMDNRYASLVKRVTPGSTAAAAGIQAGDQIVRLDGQSLLSIADLQWVLQNVPDRGGELRGAIVRGGEPTNVTLSLPPDWRHQEDWVWRYRMAGYASWLWVGFSFHDDPKGIRIGKRAPGWWKKPNRDAWKALRTGDVIVGIDGQEGMDRSLFLAYLMRDKKLGSKVELEVLRGGEREKVSFRIPKEQPEVLGH